MNSNKNTSIENMTPAGGSNQVNSAEELQTALRQHGVSIEHAVDLGRRGNADERAVIESYVMSELVSKKKSNSGEKQLT
jgi:hypothetical protein